MYALSMNKQQYEVQYKEAASLREQVKQDPWRLQYHLMPESGWLNDPNGLCQFHGTYHVYYQYSPFDVEGKVKLWGHMTSKDLITWKQEEPVLFPDSEDDVRGVYSGSAFVEDDTIHFYYTGNVKLFDDPNYDYNHHGRLQNTIHVSSNDGFHMSEKTCILKNEDYPSDMSCHVRDPKLYQKGDSTYMVLGARDQLDHGCVLLYQKDENQAWQYVNRFQVPDFGYMWECPDLFDLDGETVLLTCPQGIAQKDHHYQSVYTCGAFLVQGMDCTPPRLQPFQELDYGFDFYAPQTFLDEAGRRILIGWMGMPDIPYQNPTTAHGWQHALTLPRVLSLKDGWLYQTPIEELKQLRCDEANASADQLHQLDWMHRVYECKVTIRSLTSFTLQLRNTTSLSFQNHCLTLTIQEEGYGRTQRHIDIDSIHSLQIFSDTSSLEIFVNDGQYVMSTRVYESTPIQKLAFTDCQMQAEVVCYKSKGYSYL